MKLSTEDDFAFAWMCVSELKGNMIIYYHATALFFHGKHLLGSCIIHRKTDAIDTMRLIINNSPSASYLDGLCCPSVFYFVIAIYF